MRSKSAEVVLTNSPTPSTNSTGNQLSQSNNTFILPPITVTASTNGSLTSPSMARAERLKRQIPGALTIQGIDNLYKGRASSLSDLLQFTPGVVMLSENNVEVSKVFIRGSGVFSEDEPIGVQYLIDGLSLNQGDGEIILEDFDVGTFKYAEVFRGANALEYGALGLGGAVNFVPFTGYDAAPATVRVEGGSFGFMRGQVTSGGVDGPFDYYASVSARYRDGWRDHSRESTEFLFSDFGYKFDNNLENRFYIIADQTDRQLPGALSLQQMQTDPQQAQDGAIQQNWRKNWYYLRLADNLTYKTDTEEATLGGWWWHRNAFEPNQYITNVFLQGIESFYSDNLGVMLKSTTRATFLGGDNVLIAGINPTFEREVDQFNANFNGAMGPLTGSDTENSWNGVAFAQWQHYLTENFSLVAGLQAAYAKRAYVDRFTNSVDGNQSDTLIFRGLLPKFGAIYELGASNQLFANFSRSWQPPSFDDMVDFDTGPDTSETFTPLESQRAWTVEAGTRGKYGRFDWELALYRSWVRDELLDLNNAQGVEIGGVNIPKTINQGIEAGLTTRLANGIVVKENDQHPADELTLRQSFTLSDLRFDNNAIYGNNQIAGVPAYMYEGQLMYEAPCGFYAGPNVQWCISQYPVDNANLLYAPSYALLGFRAGCYLGKGFSVFFDARNLLNETYASSVDPISSEKAFTPPVQVFHPGDPRSFYGGVSWSW